MASLDEIHRMVLDNSRAIRGNGDKGGMKSKLAVIESTVNRIELILNGNSFATCDDLDEIKSEISTDITEMKKNMRRERLQDLEDMREKIKVVREGSVDWKWLVTALLAIVSPIAVGLYFSIVQ
jgi:hypothetical protein